MLFFEEFVHCVPTLISFYFLIKYIDESRSSTIELSSAMGCCMFLIVVLYIIISEKIIKCPYCQTKIKS
jgi:hypothetical protein